MGTADGDVEAVVTGVEVIPSVYAGSVSARWESDRRFSGIADYLGCDVVTRLPLAGRQLEAAWSLGSFCDQHTLPCSSTAAA